MRATPSPKLASDLIQWAQRTKESEGQRLPGVHVSDLVYCRRKAWYRTQFPTVEVLDDETALLFLMGHGHHAVFQYGRPETPLEWTTPDGITVYGNIDLMLDVHQNGVVCIPDICNEDHEIPYAFKVPGEIKTTRVSSKKPPEDSEHYVEQLASYCVITGSRIGVLITIHLMGNYSTVRAPQMQVAVLQFGEPEMRSWEKTMAARAREVISPDVPDLLSSHHKWECGYCPFNMANGGVCEAGGSIVMPTFISIGAGDSVLEKAG